MSWLSALANGDWSLKMINQSNNMGKQSEIKERL